jgi:hypothetical protein
MPLLRLIFAIFRHIDFRHYDAARC